MLAHVVALGQVEQLLKARFIGDVEHPLGHSRLSFATLTAAVPVACSCFSTSPNLWSAYFKMSAKTGVAYSEGWSAEFVQSWSAGFFNIGGEGHSQKRCQRDILGVI